MLSSGELLYESPRHELLRLVDPEAQQFLFRVEGVVQLTEPVGTSVDLDVDCVDLLVRLSK